jgi:hypothetical protein
VTRPVDPVIALANRQLGLVTIRQLDESGISRGQRETWIRQGWLGVVHRGVYRLAGAPCTARSAVLAVCLMIGPAAVASHVTAARLWGLGSVMQEATRDQSVAEARAVHAKGIHVAAPRQVRVPGVVSHRRRVASDERTQISGVPVTSLERTMIDLAELLGILALGRCMDEALRRGASLDRLQELSDRCLGSGPVRRWPVRVALGQRVAGFDPGANGWERRMDDMWEELGLPASVRQFAVTSGERTYVLDRAIPELKIGIEWNGFAYHGRRSGFDRDSYRRGDLAIAGWELIEVTSTWTPERLTRVVAAVVDRRRTGRSA